MESLFLLLLGLYSTVIVLGLCYFGSSTTPKVSRDTETSRHENLVSQEPHYMNVCHYPFDWLDPGHSRRDLRFTLKNS